MVAQLFCLLFSLSSVSALTSLATFFLEHSDLHPSRRVQLLRVESFASCTLLALLSYTSAELVLLYLLRFPRTEVGVIRCVIKNEENEALGYMKSRRLLSLGHGENPWENTTMRIQPQLFLLVQILGFLSLHGCF